MAYRFKWHSTFSYHKDKTVNFAEAKNKCDSLGETLATVKDLDTWQELISYEDTSAEYGYWWLGAEKQSAADEYRWLDGDVFKKFSPNVPVTGDAPGNRCLALYNHAPLKKVKLYSMPCDQHMYFICEGERWPELEKVPNTTSMKEMIFNITTTSPTSLTSYSSLMTEGFGSTRTTVSTFTTKMATKSVKSPDDDLFPLTLDSSSDPGLWMFVALSLALLLIIALIFIAKLWIDNRNLRKPKKSTSDGHVDTDGDEAQDPPANAECERENVLPIDATSPITMSTIQVEEG